MQVPEHNLDGIEIKSRDNVTYTDKNGDEIAKAVDVYIPMSVVSGDCKGELVRGKGNFSGYSYCLADDLDDVFTKRSWF